MEQYGKDWKKISIEIKTRTPEQVRSHAQKYLAKIQRIASEKKAVEEAALMTGDKLDKRLTRKKMKRINYRERDPFPEDDFFELYHKKSIKKEKDHQSKIIIPKV